MDRRGSVGSRFIKRLADGVRRERLVAPVLSLRPAVVVLAAPSGYGKTVLAAQLADSTHARHVVWLEALEPGSTVRDDVLRLADQLQRIIGTDSDVSHDPCASAAAQFSMLPDDGDVVVVFDDVVWACEEDSLSLVSDLMSEAPPGSMAVITTRLHEDSWKTHGGYWLIEAADLLFDASELAQLYRRALDREPNREAVAALARDSSGHAALASLVVRQRSISRNASASAAKDPSVSTLVGALVGQLSRSDRVLLDAAALMGSGTIRALAQCTQCRETLASLERVARVLPLVTLTKSGVDARFRVHDLVGATLTSAVRLARCDSSVLTSVVHELVVEGAVGRALDVAVAGDCIAAITMCLEALTNPLSVADHASTVGRALEALPPLDVARNASLLLVKAQLQWERSELSEAIRIATLAVGTAEHDNDAETASRALAQVLLWRSAIGDFEGVASQSLALLDSTDTTADPESWAVALASGILAAGLLGDRANLARFVERGQSLVDSVAVSGMARARLEITRGVVLSLLDGDWPSATMAFRNATVQSGSSLCAATAHQNLAAAFYEQGLFEDAASSISTAQSLGRVASSEPDEPDSHALACAISVLRGEHAEWKHATEAAFDESVAAHDWLAASSLLVMAPRTAICERDFACAASLAERAVSVSVSTGSPILMWYAQVVHAQAALACGDRHRAKMIALRIQPLAADVGAMGHLLHCRMILSEVARGEGDFASAVEHLERVSEYIIEKSPALTVVSYLRAFPEMLGPLAVAMGIDCIPARILRLLGDAHGSEALSAASAVLTAAEVRSLSARMRLEAERVAEQERVSDLSDAVCRVRLLGRLEVVVPHGPVGERDWGKRKARLLFAMLVARAGTDVPRGEIIEYLWPDMDESRAVNNFYVVWSAMKRALVPRTGRDTPFPYIEHVHEVCRVVPGRIVTDLDEFESHVVAARRAREQGDLGGELEAIRSAEQVYRGDLLPGDIYDDWFAPLRARTRHAFEDVMLRGAMILEERGNPHEGLALLRRSMSDDTLREDFYQALLRLQIAAGQRSEAIETYMSCRDRLVEELGIDPSRETTSLYEQILGMEEPCR